MENNRFVFVCNLPFAVASDLKIHFGKRYERNAKKAEANKINFAFFAFLIEMFQASFGSIACLKVFFLLFLFCFCVGHP